MKLAFWAIDLRLFYFFEFIFLQIKKKFENGGPKGQFQNWKIC